MRVRTVALATLAGAALVTGSFFAGALASPQGASATDRPEPAAVSHAWTADESPGPIRALDRHARIGLPLMAELARVADDLDLDLGEFRAAVAGGATIGEAATAQGVDPANLVAALVEVGEASIARAEERGRLDAGRAAELRERLEERVAELVEGSLPQPGPIDHRPRAWLGVVAEVIGIDVTDLLEALREGKSVAEIADEQGVDRETLVDGLVDSARGRIEAWVDTSLGGAPDRRG